jgi:hypothetical protein
MRRFSILLALFGTLLAPVGGLFAAAPAAAAGSQAVADCNAHARLTQQYSAGQLRAALSTMPADVKEYTDCFDVIQRQLLAQIGGSHQNGGSGQGSGGSFLPTPLIVVLVALVVGAGIFAAVAVRRRGGGGPPAPAG